MNGEGWVPVGALPVIADGTQEYVESVGATGAALNATYQSFCSAPEGIGFSGHVCIIGEFTRDFSSFDIMLLYLYL